ncbi:MAG: ABC transporter ATP-binding protein, partial [Frankia sp.]|nr:ABC transporter ATP-binding protein [Frankia sp.]
MSTATSTSAATGADGADGDDRPAGRGHAGLRSFVRFMWTFRGRMALIGGVFVVANGCLAVIPLFIGEFVAVLATDPVPRGAAYGWAAALIACTIGHDLTWRAGDLLYMRLLLGRTFEYENILFQRVIEGEYPYFAGRSTGKIGSYLRTLGQEFRVFLDNVYFAYLEQIIKLPAIVLIMFSVNLPTGLAFTVAIALLALVGRRTARLSARAEGRAADVSADMDSYVFDVVANFVAVKSFRRERAEQAEVRRRRRHVTVAAKKSMFAGIVFWASMSAVVRWLVWPGTILLNLHLFLRGDL